MGFDALVTFASRILFFGILVFFALGRWVGRRRLGRDPVAARSGSGSIDGFVSALAGLLIAFTLVGAGERFETRRRLVVEEANTIGTAWLRLDLMSDARRSELRDQFGCTERKQLTMRRDPFGAE